MLSVSRGIHDLIERVDHSGTDLSGIFVSVAGSWGSRGSGGGMVAGSPGVGGMSNSSSSSSGASWRSGTPSPPLSEEGVPMSSSPCPTTSHPSHNQPHYPYVASGSSSGSTPGSTTLDEGIVPDYIEEQHPRKKVNNPLPLCVCSLGLPPRFLHPRLARRQMIVFDKFAGLLISLQKGRERERERENFWNPRESFFIRLRDDDRSV